MTAPRGLLRRQALLGGLCGLTLGVGLWPCAAHATAPLSLCGNAPPPPYPGVDQWPTVQSWLLEGRDDGPQPDCTGLPSRDVEMLVRVTGSWRAPGTLDDRLARLGAVSTQTGMSYWSFTDRRRQVLIRESQAVSSLAQRQRRGDFSPAELRSGAECVFVQTDNRTSTPVPYGMQLLKATPQAFTVRVESLGDIRMLGLLLVAEHEMQWLLTVERLGHGHWGYRSLLGLSRLRLGGNEQHRLSNLSRSLAVFDFLTGRQTEVERYR